MRFEVRFVEGVGVRVDFVEGVGAAWWELPVRVCARRGPDTVACSFFRVSTTVVVIQSEESSESQSMIQ